MRKSGGPPKPSRGLRAAARGKNRAHLNEAAEAGAECGAAILAEAQRLLPRSISVRFAAAGRCAQLR